MTRTRLSLITLPLLIAACASDAVPRTEQMLAASGFRFEPANTPERLAQLMELPPHQVVLQSVAEPNRQPEYVYADPDHCRCLFFGGPAQYQYFQQLAVQQRIAHQQMQAAMINQDAAMRMEMAPPVIVVPEHRHR